MSDLEPIIVSLIFNGIDLATGVVSAVKNKEIKSAKLRDGLFKKVGFLACYFLAWFIDNYGYLVGFHFDFKLLAVIVSYVCTTELVSIIENISTINSDLLPEKLMSLFNISNDKKGE